MRTTRERSRHPLLVYLCCNMRGVYSDVYRMSISWYSKSTLRVHEFTTCTQRGEGGPTEDWPLQYLRVRVGWRTIPPSHTTYLLDSTSLASPLARRETPFAHTSHLASPSPSSYIFRGRAQNASPTSLSSSRCDSERISPDFGGNLDFNIPLPSSYLAGSPRLKAPKGGRRRAGCYRESMKNAALVRYDEYSPRAHSRC